MYQIRKRVLAAILSLVTLLSNIPASNLYAQEHTVSQGEKFVAQDTSNFADDKLKLEYLYLEHLAIIANEEQAITVLWNESVPKMGLVIENIDTAEQIELWESIQNEGLFTFKKAFTDTEVSTYQVVEIKVWEEDAEHAYRLPDMGVQAFFEVKEQPSIDVDEQPLVDANEAPFVEQNEGVLVGEVFAAEDSRSSDEQERQMREQSVRRRGWINEDGIYYYYLDNGTKATGWQKVYDDWYYLDATGKMQTGWLAYGARRYYLNGSGQMLTGTHRIAGVRHTFHADGYLTGWLKENDTYSYFRANGIKSVGWEKVFDDWYYFDREGKMQTGWLAYGARRYYLNSSGQMLTGTHRIAGARHAFHADGYLTGWLKENDTYTYFKANGVRSVGWEKVFDDWYYFDREGKMQTGWLNYASRRYYLNSSGQMLTGTRVIAGETYRFNGDGILIGQGVLKRGWVNEGGIYYYYFDNGVMAKGWQKVYNDWYYLDAEGKMQTGWLTLGSRQYYLNRSGQMLVGTHTIAGERCHFNGDGILIMRGEQTKGWIRVENAYYYYLENGNLATGWLKVYDDWYYLDNYGKMRTGWLTWSGQTYYLNGSGQMLRGAHNIGGRVYHFDSSGVLRVNRAKDVLDAARSQVGTVGGLKYENELMARGGELCIGRGYWCGAFVWWAFHQAGANDAYVGGRPEAYPYQIYDYYRQRSQLVSYPQAGDLAFMKWSNLPGQPTLLSHVAIVESVSGSTITVLEGNIGGGAGRVVRSTWPMWSSARPQVVAYARPSY